MDYMTFRQSFFSGRTLRSEEQRRSAPKLNKDELEELVRREYERHYGKKE